MLDGAVGLWGYFALIWLLLRKINLSTEFSYLWNILTKLNPLKKIFWWSPIKQNLVVCRTPFSNPNSFLWLDLGYNWLFPHGKTFTFLWPWKIHNPSTLKLWCPIIFSNFHQMLSTYFELIPITTK